MTLAEDADRATVLLERALAACAKELDAALPGWRSKRVGLAIGTSSGGMRSFEAAFAAGGAPEGSLAATYLGPVIAAARPCDLEPVAFVLGACASGTLAIGLAREWLLAGACDLVLCGGFDAVSVFVASGFEVLRAVCTDGAPRPFRAGRDGLALGEGAAVMALVRGDDAALASGSLAPHGFVTGFGASCDAVHLTAPDREGKGLARAAEQALADAGRPRDRARERARHGDGVQRRVGGACARRGPRRAPRRGAGPRAEGRDRPHARRRGRARDARRAARDEASSVAPASAGTGPIEGGVRVLERAEQHEASRGAEAVGARSAARTPRSSCARERGAAAGRGARAAREVFVSRAVAIVDDVAAASDAHELAARTGYAEDKLARADGLVRLTIGAVAAASRAARRGGAGDARRRRDPRRSRARHDRHERRLPRADPRARERAVASRGASRTRRRTPPAGECAVAFGLTGPAFAVGGGPHGGLEALAVAADLVRGGVADRIVVVGVDEAGEGSRRVAPATQARRRRAARGGRAPVGAPRVVVGAVARRASARGDALATRARASRPIARSCPSPSGPAGEPRSRGPRGEDLPMRACSGSNSAGLGHAADLAESP